MASPSGDPESLTWCRRWIDPLEEMVRKQGHFASDDQRDDVVDVLTRARLYVQPEVS